MKMVYTNENHFIVNNVKNLIETEEISTFIKNEFAQGAVGEISAFDSWPEVWVVDDADYECAMAIVNESKSNDKGEDWVCDSCLEKNGSAFEMCWSCQTINE